MDSRGCAVTAAPFVLIAAVTLASVAPVEAQVRRAPREPSAFVSVNGGVQQVSAQTDSFTVEQYAETGTVRAELAGNTATLLDVSAGMRIWKRLGLGIAVTRASASREAAIRAEVPHPLYLDTPRTVEGTARNLSRTDTGIHPQLYWEPRLTGRLRVRLFAGPSVFEVQQDLVELIDVDEAYPFDEATFRSARTRRASGSAVGGHAGVDAAWMLSRQVGLGGSLRYAAARLDLNRPSTPPVSLDAGGVQAAAGLRLVF